MLTSAKLRESWYQNVYFLKLHMCVYLRIKLEGSSITLTSFRQGLILQPPKSKQTLKKPSQIRVKAFDKKH